MRAAIDDPGCSSDADRELAELLDQVARKLEAGEPVDWNALAREHPEYSERLKSLSPALHMMADLGYSLEPGTGTGAQPSDRPAGLGVLGDHRIMREIGRGGMAVVYEAEQISLGRRVALKVLPFAAVLDSKQLQRFKNEAHAAAQLHHQNIVPVYSVGCERGVHYYAMQYIEGQTLAEAIEELRVGQELRPEAEEVSAGPSCTAPDDNVSAPRPAPAPTTPVTLNLQRSTSPLGALSTERSANCREFFRTVARLGVQAAEALEHAHSMGVVHRDIKPGNLMLDTRGVLWITDFGLAHFSAETGHSLTMTGDLVGTLRYMSPEQALAHRVMVDHRTDVYSLGVTLYEFLTLEAAFDGRDRQEVLRKIAFEDPRAPHLVNKTVPAELETILLKAMEKKPEDRYATAHELAEDLCRFLEDRPIRAKRPTLLLRARKWARRHRAVVWSAAVAAALVLVVAVFALAVSNVLISREQKHTLAEKLKVEQAERQSKHRLFDARLAQARASRWSRKLGQRFDSWRAANEAAELARELELGEARALEIRTEAIACLALADLRPAREPWEGWPPGSTSGLAFDANLERYARSDLKGNISVRSVADDQELAQLPGTGGGAAQIAFSPNGNVLAAQYFPELPDQPNTLRLWDWPRAHVILNLSAPVHSAMEFSPDGQLLMLGHDDETLTIHQSETGTQVRSMKLGLTPYHVTMSHDGSKLAISTPGEVQVRDAVTGNLLRKLSVPGAVWQLAWHPDGDLLAAASEDSNVYLMSTATGQLRAVMRGHQAAVVRVTFAPGGDMLVSSGYDGTSRLWDPSTGRESVRFSGMAYGFSRDGRRLASHSGYSLNVWDVAFGREYRTLPGGHSASREHIRGGSMSPDGRWLAVAQGGSHRLWDLQSGVVTNVYNETHAVDARIHPSGREMFTSGRAGLYRWPMRMDAGVLQIGPARRLPLAGATGSVALDRDGRLLAAAGGIRGGWVLDLEQLDQKNPLGSVTQVDHINTHSVATSPNGRWLATGTQHGFGVKVWETRSGRPAFPEPLIPNERVVSVVFSPDGRWLVTASETEFDIWEVGSWQLVRRIRKEQAGSPGRAAFTPDGKILAVDVSIGVVLLLDPATGRAFARLEAPEPSPISWLAFTPDAGHLVVCAEAGRTALWNLRRIREQLSEIALDWDASPCPPFQPLGGPIEIKIDLGELANPRDEFEEYRRALEANPNDATANNNLAWLYATGPAERRDPHKALSLAENAVRLEPDTWHFRNTLGVVYYRLAEWNKAVAMLQSGIAANQNNPTAFDLFFLAMSHHQLGEHERAREAYEQALGWLQTQKDLPHEWTEELAAFRAETEELLKQN